MLLKVCKNVALYVLTIYIAIALIPVGSQFWISDHGGLEVEPAVAEVDHDVDVLDGGRGAAEDLSGGERLGLGHRHLHPLLPDLAGHRLQRRHELDRAGK